MNDEVWKTVDDACIYKISVIFLLQYNYEKIQGPSTNLPTLDI